MFEFFKRLIGYSVGRQLGIPGSLRGRYDIMGDTLAGHVQIELAVASPGLEILVLRNGAQIASCTPAPMTPDGLRQFTMPIDGRFNAAELARGTVTIAARNRRGDTGVLTLQGSTMLALVRDQFGAPSETILDLDFSDAGNARPFLGAGWWRADKDYTWAMDDERVVTFPAPEAPGDYLLRVTCAPFILATVTVQPLDIKLDGELVGSLQETEQAMQFYEFRMNGSDFTARPMSTLQFVHVNAERPSDHVGSADTRRLAFRFRRVSLVRLLQE